MQNYEEFQNLKTWHPMFDGIAHNCRNLKLLLVSDDEDKRLEACKYFKELLKEKLDEEKKQGNLKKYGIKIIDINDKDAIYDDYNFWDNVGIVESKLFIPIFHNADKHPYLPQFIFDGNKPEILSYSEDGWNNIINYSKRNSYRTLRPDG